MMTGQKMRKRKVQITPTKSCNQPVINLMAQKTVVMKVTLMRKTHKKVRSKNKMRRRKKKMIWRMRMTIAEKSLIWML